MFNLSLKSMFKIVWRSYTQHFNIRPLQYTILKIACRRGIIVYIDIWSIYIDNDILIR